jgi:uncharacterized protein YraI
MNRTHLLLLGIGFGLVVPAASSAETAYTTKTVNLRAGPSRDYELVSRIPAGVPVDVYGCVDDWTWCDVSAGDDRGWMYAGNLEYPYRNRRVVVLGNGLMFGFPIVTFSVGPYWDTYYRGRPWYSRRSYWAGRPAPNRWIGSPGSRPQGFRSPGSRPQGLRSPGSRPQGPRPPVSRPQGFRPQTASPPRPAVVRPPVNRPQPQAQPQRQRGGRPEAVRPQPQPGRAAPARPPDNRGRQPQREERKPGGN